MSSERHFMDIFFNPDSVAVVGASRNMGTANYWLTANLVNLKYPARYTRSIPTLLNSLG